MSVAKTPSAEIVKALKHDNLSVNSRVARAIGKIVIFLGLDHKSSREMLSRAVGSLFDQFLLVRWTNPVYRSSRSCKAGL